MRLPNRIYDPVVPSMWKDRYVFAAFAAFVVAVVTAGVLFGNAMAARSCAIASHQYRLRTHYVTLDSCYVTQRDGTTVDLGQYQSVRIERGK